MFYESIPDLVGGFLGRYPVLGGVEAGYAFHKALFLDGDGRGEVVGAAYFDQFWGQHLGGDVQQFGVVGAGGYFALGDDAQVGVFVELAADDGPGAGGQGAGDPAAR